MNPTPEAGSILRCVTVVSHSDIYESLKAINQICNIIYILYQEVETV